MARICISVCVCIKFGLKKEKNPVTCYSMDELEDTMLSEISQSQKDKYCMILLI